MASLYFSSDLASASVGEVISLTGDEAKHAVAVARTRVGQQLSIGNGHGLVAHGTVTSLDPFALEVTRVREEPRPTPELWLVQALAKGDRDELAVQAATELGVSGVIPWAAERSVTRWEGAKIEKGRARWEAIVREASKQSIRAHIPAVLPLTATKDLGAGLIVLDPTAEQTITAVDLAGLDRIALVVGPEGGISPRELQVLEQSGAQRVRLGSEILRTSTAGPAAIAVLNARLGRW